MAPLLKSNLGLQDGVSLIIFATVPVAVLFSTFHQFDFLLSPAGGSRNIAMRAFGAALSAAGVFLSIGNRSGAYTTFAFAGTILTLIGLALLVIGSEEH